MSISISFPCGCEVNEHYVIAMCFPHCQQLATMRLDRKKRTEAIHEKLINDVRDHLVNPGKVS